MTILGIDPGTASMGYGVIHIHEETGPILKDFGVIKTHLVGATIGFELGVLDFQYCLDRVVDIRELAP